MREHAAKRLRETGVRGGLRLGPRAIDITDRGRRGGEALARVIRQSDGVDRTGVVGVHDGSVGRAKPSGEVIGHIGIAAAEFVRDGLRDLGSGAARRHDRVHVLRDGRGARIIRDLLPVRLGPVDHIAGLCQQFGTLREIRLLLALDPTLRPVGDFQSRAST